MTKRREHAATRKASERNLAALWADLQPFLVEKQALSLPAIEALNSVIPLTTDDDGEDIVLEQPPPPPETPVQDEANSPSTPPPGPSDPGDPSTPTQLLGGFSFTSPPRQGPPRRSPEKKTKDDGECLSNTVFNPMRMYLPMPASCLESSLTGCRQIVL